jgi:hypothetical protein
MRTVSDGWPFGYVKAVQAELGWTEAKAVKSARDMTDRQYRQAVSNSAGMAEYLAAREAHSSTTTK